jgi:AcrR family transcriptional regulator
MSLNHIQYGGGSYLSRIVKDSEERKEELLQIGIQLFLQGGTKSVSIQNVVKEAKVATGLFYYYFKNKEDFMQQSLERYAYDYIIKIRKIVENKNLPILERLDSLIIQLNIRFGEVIKINNDELLNTPHHLALEEAIIQQAHKMMSGFIREGNESRYFRVSDPDLTALYLVCGLMGALLRTSESNSDKTNEEIKRLVINTLAVDEKT